MNIDIGAHIAYIWCVKCILPTPNIVLLH